MTTLVHHGQPVIAGIAGSCDCSRSGRCACARACVCSADSPSSLLRLSSCRSRPGSLQGGAQETRSRCRPLAGRWRTGHRSHGDESLRRGQSAAALARWDADAAPMEAPGEGKKGRGRGKPRAAGAPIKWELEAWDKACHICHQPAEEGDKGRVLFIHHQKVRVCFQRGEIQRLGNEEIDVGQTHTRNDRDRLAKNMKGLRWAKKLLWTNHFSQILPFIFDASWIRQWDISVTHRGHYAGLSNHCGTNSSRDLVVSHNEGWRRDKHRARMDGTCWKSLLQTSTASLLSKQT